MIDITSLPVSGGAFLGAVAWAGISAFALGPLVADRTIQKSNWPQICQSKLTASLRERMPTAQSRPTVRCDNVMSIFGPQARQFCSQGGDALVDLLMTDPLAAQKEQLRQRQVARLRSIAANAPSRCSCAATTVVKADRLSWGLYAGSARLLGGPSDLSADLTTALSSPTCQRLGEVSQ